MAFELTRQQAERARDVFMEVLDAAVPAYELEQYKLLEARDEEYIRKETERMLYEPRLPNAGPKEQRIVDRLRKIARNKQVDEKSREDAKRAAKKWSEIHGWYYKRTPMTPKSHKQEYLRHTRLLESAREEQEWELVWFHRLILQGPPEPVADFRMECLFLLRRSDGHTDRMVKLRNIVNEKTKKAVVLQAELYKAPEKFRGWCLDQGNFHWAGNQVDLQLLHQDIGRASAWRMVNEVSQCGWLPLEGLKRPGQIIQEGLWITGDAVYAPNGHRLEPDDNGVYWFRDEGYRLSETGRENKWHQRLPLMYPEVGILSAPLELAHQPTVRTPESVLQAFWLETCDRMRRTTGGFDAYLMIGGILAYFAGPEIFTEYLEFTGQWIHGERESGKSTTAGWLMEFHGLHLGRKGISLRGTNSTPTGLAQALDQYSNIPVWVDEFRFAEVGADKLSVLHQAYNRGGQTKFSASMIQRDTRTNFIVSGESTTNDAALRGRYMHIQMSANRREVDAAGNVVPHSAWIEAHRKYFFFFGRHILERREKYAELVMTVLKRWREMPGISERTKMAFGIPYAGFMAMAQLMEGPMPDVLTDLKRHAMRLAHEAAAEVISETNINVIWDHLITAFVAKDIEPRCFRLRREHATHPPGAPNQMGWMSYYLYMDVNATLGALNEYFVKNRLPMTINRRDLQDQLKQQPYWVEGKHQVRFGTGTESRKCWCFAVDLHDMGYRKSSDEEWNHFMQNQNESDPREGPLFAIVHAVEREERAKA